MKIFITLTIFLATVLTLVTISCSKDKGSCYDEQLYQKHKNDFCTADCPGVEGCDGKTYCNECVANRQGIRKK
ncbi:MAG: hypothetical protein Q7W13_09920 [Bacteroidia bacterium]|nr:hypothetical protein [Bacteroidia bacterium]